MDYEGTLEVTFLLAALIISLVSPTDSNETINFELFLSVENLTKDGTVFDSSAARNAPFGPFVHGRGQIIQVFICNPIFMSYVHVVDIFHNHLILPVPVTTIYYQPLALASIISTTTRYNYVNCHTLSIQYA